MPLTDTDLMPFGVHKGKKMANVPAAYLMYLWKSVYFEKEKQSVPVSIYIKENLDVIKSEL